MDGPRDRPDTSVNSTALTAPQPAGPARKAAGQRPRAMLFALAALASLGVFLCGAAAALVGAYFYYNQELPSAEQLVTVHLDQSTKIYDRNGGLLFELLDAQGGHRTIVKPEQFPAAFKDATVATEDPSFYNNPGVDPIGILRAVYYDLRHGRVIAGGSTITQQLVKNVFLSPEPTLERKMREAFLAVGLTFTYSKQQILGFYLNTVYYGNLAYGAQAGAQAYFRKDVSQLDLAEASLLAGLPQAPARYDPCQDRSAALERQQTVLKLMMRAGKISEVEATAAAAEMERVVHSAEFDRQCAAGVALRYPHFVNYVRTQLEKQYGPEVVARGGLQVTTTLDPAAQEVAQEEARRQIAALRVKNVTNAAVVVLKPESGEILAMLGSVDFNNKEISGQVNVADRARQPGSSIKPINYVTAFKNGWNPATTLYDLPTNFPDGNGRPPYVPANYDGRSHGIISARTALANSLNIPAVKTLYSTSSKDANNFPRPLEMLDMARRLGITSLSGAVDGPQAPYGLALTLGGGEVKLIELADAYDAFANQGARMPASPYLKIVDGKGKVIYDLHGKEKQQPVCAGFDPGVQDEKADAKGVCAASAPYAFMVTSILSDNAARELAFGPNSVLQLGRPAAVKTGTTNDFRDNWTIGYTPDLLVGVWVGNANNSAMQGVSGIDGAAPIWHSVMERLLKDTPPHEFAMPAGVVQKEVCIDSGLLATELCPAARRRLEYLPAAHLPKSDTVWREMKNCSGAREVFQVPPHDVGDLIPYEQILDWARRNGWKAPVTENEACPAGSPPAPNPGSALKPNPNPPPSNSNRGGQQGKEKGGKGNGEGKGK